MRAIVNMDTIVLRPKNPRESPAADLEPLAEEIRRGLDGVAVSVQVPPEQRVAVTLAEVIDVVVTSVDHVTSPVLTALLVAWAKQRFTKAETTPGAPVPKQIVLLYGPDNKVIRRIEVDAPDSEAKVHDSKAQGPR